MAFNVRTCSPHATLAVPTQSAVEAQLAEGQIRTGSIKHSVQRLDTGWTIRCSIPGSGNKFLSSPKGPEYLSLSISFLLSRWKGILSHW
jgi:hypothetical protein